MPGFTPWAIPGLSEIPIIGPVFFDQDPLIYLLYLLVPFLYRLLYRSSWGLEVRATGENPGAADSAGVPVYSVRFMCTLISGGLAGLGGAYIVVSQVFVFTEHMSAGKGFIALAADHPRSLGSDWSAACLLVLRLLRCAAAAPAIRQSVGALSDFHGPSICRLDPCAHRALWPGQAAGLGRPCPIGAKRRADDTMLLPVGHLTLKNLRDFAGRRPRSRWRRKTRARMARTRKIVEACIDRGIATYGVNTGFGTLSGHVISAKDLDDLQRRLILSNAAGTGKLMSRDDTRRMLLLKAAALATGYSGARPELADAILAFLNHDITPCVPEKGSVGASGDLAPLAHMAAALIGVGDVIHRGQIVPATEALKAEGLKPFVLKAKEGLSLVNGTQASTALAVSGLFAAEDLMAAALVAGALSVEAAFGKDAAFDARLHEARGQPGQIAVASVLRSLLAGSAIQDEARRMGRFRIRIASDASLK